MAATYTAAHGNAGSFNPLARDQTRILMDTSQIFKPLSHNGNSVKSFIFTILPSSNTEYLIVPPMDSTFHADSPAMRGEERVRKGDCMKSRAGLCRQALEGAMPHT